MNSGGIGTYLVLKKRVKRGYRKKRVKRGYRKQYSSYKFWAA
jgi:hypothetical protein